VAHTVECRALGLVLSTAIKKKKKSNKDPSIYTEIYSFILFSHVSASVILSCNDFTGGNMRRMRIPILEMGKLSERLRSLPKSHSK
jgi:hypothetical protein